MGNILPIIAPYVLTSNILRFITKVDSNMQYVAQWTKDGAPAMFG
jgi:hypothetical protein